MRQPCLRCLLAELPSGQAVLERIRQELGRLPPGELAEPGRRQARLAACRTCPWLQDGTCLKCGCYVEMRALLKNGRCPDVPARWGKP